MISPTASAPPLPDWPARRPIFALSKKSKKKPSPQLWKPPTTKLAAPPKSSASAARPYSKNARNISSSENSPAHARQDPPPGNARRHRRLCKTHQPPIADRSHRSPRRRSRDQETGRRPRGRRHPSRRRRKNFRLTGFREMVSRAARSRYPRANLPLRRCRRLPRSVAPARSPKTLARRHDVLPRVSPRHASRTALPRLRHPFRQPLSKIGPLSNHLSQTRPCSGRRPWRALFATPHPATRSLPVRPPLGPSARKTLISNELSPTK